MMSDARSLMTQPLGRFHRARHLPFRHGFQSSRDTIRDYADPGAGIVTSAGTSCGRFRCCPGAGICKQYTGLAGESAAEARLMGELLKYEQVEISYRGLPVVRMSVSLRKERSSGSGESGSGKST